MSAQVVRRPVGLAPDQRDSEVLRAEISQLRREMAGTMAALAAKADIKSQLVRRTSAGLRGLAASAEPLTRRLDAGVATDIRALPAEMAGNVIEFATKADVRGRLERRAGVRIRELLTTTETLRRKLGAGTKLSRPLQLGKALSRPLQLGKALSRPLQLGKALSGQLGALGGDKGLGRQLAASVVAGALGAGGGLGRRFAAGLAAAIGARLQAASRGAAAASDGAAVAAPGRAAAAVLGRAAAAVSGAAASGPKHAQDTTSFKPNPGSLLLVGMTVFRVLRFRRRIRRIRRRFRRR